MRHLHTVESWCDYCDRQNGRLTMMQLTGREEYDREANVLYPRYAEVCSDCVPTMASMGYTDIRKLSA